MNRDKIIGIIFLFLASSLVLFSTLLVSNPTLYEFSYVLIIIILPLIIFFYWLGFKLIVYESMNLKTACELYKYILKEYSSNRFLSVSGIDGSGKTTQLLLLSELLENLGIDNKIIWFRWPAFFVYPALMIAKLVGLSHRINIYHDRKEYNIVIHEYYRNNVLSTIISVLIIIDFIISFYVKIFIPYKLFRRKTWILCDRFLIDVIVDVYGWTRNNILFSRTFLKIYKKLLSKCPSLLFDIDVNVAFKRKPDLPLSVFLFNRYLYLLAARIFNIEKIEVTNLHKHRIFKLFLKKHDLIDVIYLYVLFKKYFYYTCKQ